MADNPTEIVSQLTGEVTSFIERAAPVLDKTAKLDEALGAKLPQVVEKLASLGMIPQNMKQAKLAQFSADPSQLCDLLMKVATRVAAPGMGAPADAPSGDTTGMTADERFVHNMAGLSRRA